MDLFQKLIDRDGFALGEPWRLNEKSLIVVVPVLKNPPPGERRYITGEEAKKDLELTDSGSIGLLQVRNESGKPVFVRIGTIFEGLGTQSRGAEHSVVLEPAARGIGIPVKCVQASHPISRGSAFNVSSSSSPVDSAFLHRRSQTETWGLVSSSTARYAAMQHGSFQAGRPGYGAPSYSSDNLVASLNSVPLSVSAGPVSAAVKDIADLISKIPVDMNSQVGVCVLDLDGVREFEAFDHPDSWRAIAKSIARKYAPEMDAPGKLLFDLKKENVESAVTEFLLSAHKKDTVPTRSGSSTLRLIDADEAVGEYTELDGSGIHLILARKQKRAEDSMRSYRPAIHQNPPTFESRTTTEGITTPQIWTTSSSFPPLVDTWESSVFERRKHHLFVTEAIRDRERSWMDVSRAVQRLERRPVNPKTLSDTLREGVAEGYISKTRPQGKRRNLYRLTAKGSSLLEKKVTA